MIRRSMDLLVQPEGPGRVVLRAPAVGYFSGWAREGEGLIGGSRAGSLEVAGRTIDLLVPEGAEGLVAALHTDVRLAPVAYGDPLLTLESMKVASAAKRKRSAPGAAGGVQGAPDAGEPIVSARDGSASRDTIPPGAGALRAPTTGVFYARPDPSAPPFAELGAVLETGQTAGYIEVMKCFSPIVHPGGAVPSPGRIEQIRVREGEEVHPGQILFVLVPAQ